MFSHVPIISIALYLITIVSAEDECPARFLRHVNPPACPTRQSGCELLKGGDDWNIGEILHAHNTLRNMIASGKHGFPEAADMMQVEWDDELALHAQKLTESCEEKIKFAWTADIGDRGTADISETEDTISWTRVVENLYGDIKKLLNNPSPDKSAIDAYFKLGNDFVVALLRARMWLLGAGWAKYKDSSQNVHRIAKFYHGYYIESPDPIRYVLGKAASQCPHNTKPSKKYPALCKALTKFGPTDIDVPAVRRSPDTIFFCDFADQSLCKLRIAHSTDDRVSAIETDRYTYLSIIIRGGENATITFPVNFETCIEACLNVDYAHGPSIHGTTRASVVAVKHASGKNILYREGLGDIWGVGKMKIELVEGTPLTWLISSPPGSPEEFFEVRRIIISEDMSLCRFKKWIGEY